MTQRCQSIHGGSIPRSLSELPQSWSAELLAPLSLGIADKPNCLAELEAPRSAKDLSHDGCCPSSAALFSSKRFRL